jgi:hypothetical protein
MLRFFETFVVASPMEVFGTGGRRVAKVEESLANSLASHGRPFRLPFLAY